MADETKLLDAKIQFYLENPQQALQILLDIKSKDLRINSMKDVFMYRCYLLQNKYSIPLNEIDPTNCSTALLSIRLLAKYLCNRDTRDEVQKEIEHLQTQNLDVDDDVSLAVWAQFYLYSKRPDLALRVLHNNEESMECISISIQALLQLNRLDLAQKKLKKIMEKNEDNLLTQLSMASVYLILGGSKLREAYNIFQELSEKYRTSSNLVLIGKAVALIGLGELDEANSMLQEAISRNPNDSDALVNLLVLSQMQNKPIEIINRYISQLKEADPLHPLVVDLKSKEEEFDNGVQNYLINSE